MLPENVPYLRSGTVLYLQVFKSAFLQSFRLFFLALLGIDVDGIISREVVCTFWSVKCVITNYLLKNSV